MTLLSLAQARIPDLRKKTAKEWAGPCPECGGTDRFLVWVHKDAWYCRHCDVAGDDVAFLRRFCGRTCPEAHAELGKSCESTTCEVREKCSQGHRGAAPRARRPLQAPKPAAAPEFTPAAATAPADLWRTQAAKLIERAHAALLDSPEQLAYLAGRGLPRPAVESYHLGWLAEDLYRPRAAWGLPEILREDGKPKKLWLPAGIVIPFFAAEGHPDRIRIRRSKVKEGEARYYWAPGSGDDVPVLGRGARAFVVVESDLDAFLVHFHAGDLAGAVPLGTCSAKPKETAAEILGRALCILVALDFEPRVNSITGRPENPGGQAAIWWEKHFPRAVRWPVPAGKDPGDFFKDHGDIRAWVLAGLPPVFHVAAAKTAGNVPAPLVGEGQGAGVSLPAEASAPARPSLAAAPENQPVLMERAGGRPLILVYTRGQFRQMVEVQLAKESEGRPVVAVVGSSELDKIPAEIGELCLAVKSIWPGAVVTETRPIVGDGRSNVVRFDPSRQRRAGRDK